MQRAILLLGLLCALPFAAIAQQKRPTTRVDSAANPAPEDRPCPGQPRTYRAFRREYRAAKSTARQPLLGTWALIGYLTGTEARSAIALLNCAGVRNGPMVVQVLIVRRDSVSNESFWNLRWNPAQPFEERTHDEQGNLTFLAESGGDNVEVYHCRLSRRGTLLCLESDLPYGLEFRQMDLPAQLRPSAHLRDPTR